ncbi:anti-sigma-factor antagonist [Bacillus sp. FJAT-27231]|uniref:STAS domain-containing protein n=1 Tax=Bacillus sp. FJAT-27231 TaxID=1679168 RepID=UPI000670761E|nr:STAS domain-containing protein [Bacillus sp. FJAT-27231]KMY53347.1 anti-sigma-factor antagonist [Bacillus sp. FJAT-27231]
MKNELQLLGKKIIEKKVQLAEEIHNERLKGISAREKEQLAPVEAGILEMRAEFIHLFGEALLNYAKEEFVHESIAKWGKETGEAIFQLGVPLDEALKDTRFYRMFIWKAIREEVKKNQMTIDTVFDASSIIDALLDEAVYYFSLTFVEFHERMLNEAKKAFIEVSAPVVPVTKEIAILPLIGNVDAERAQYLMETTLTSAKKLQLSHLILDLSGVLTVDTMVADQIFKVVNALKLLGVETIITGIQPEISHTLVSIGIDFKSIQTKATLQQALEDLYN